MYVCMFGCLCICMYECISNMINPVVPIFKVGDGIFVLGVVFSLTVFDKITLISLNLISRA